jgi:hypothetical protein
LWKQPFEPANHIIGVWLRVHNGEGGIVVPGGAASPVYVIIKGRMVPARSPESEEIARIKSVGEFVEVNQPTLNQPRGRPIRVCGGSRWISVREQYMELRRLGYPVAVREPGSYVLDYDGVYRSRGPGTGARLAQS